ncbi:molybdopterin-dependent oxidoreductase [Oceanicoccus sp. KOV_DT_Chl]|uniref:molybdopterin-containing oxidoreductase family protein n=1 Tax=Oceanicoccus sp. KOV_DT_Chl TaxID=1904639 RepID=UPI000C7E2F29|nr:molybdopterin-dependent oxidoreductase [Oceanicoccus sp. KOV_DT_Chl]
MTATTATIVPTICRLCIANCGVLATVEDDAGRRKVTKVTGDPENPLFKGYTCPKGRALPELHNHQGRLLTSLKKQPDGSHQAIKSEQAVVEIAERIKTIVDQYGPRSVAFYVGTPNAGQPTAAGVGNAFMRAIGSRMFFTSNTIDQPGKQISTALHGKWLGGEPDFEQADAWLLVGSNPIISKSAGIPGQNPAQKLKEAQARGMQLIVIDPRVSDSARKATFHLQCRPGEDHAILAGMLNVIIQEQLFDADFVADNVTGFEQLAEHVASFTPEYVADRAGIPAQQLQQAARVFAGAKIRHANSGTGASFSMYCNLKDYLLACLNTVCGAYTRAGERVTRPNAMLPAYTPKAQALAPFKAWGYGEKLRVRGLTDTAAGLPTAALADEILLTGEGQVKALICIGGNPMAAWPDQRKTQRAMEALELLVTFDVEMSTTARLADYVIACKQTLETPGMSQSGEAIKYFGTGIGFPNAYAQYSPRVADVPHGSDLVEEWEFFYQMANHLGLELVFVAAFGFSKYQEASFEIMPLSTEQKPTMEDLYASICAHSRIPLEEVKKYPHGHIFDSDVRVAEKDFDCEAKLDCANAFMMSQLAEVFAQDYQAMHNTPDYPFRYIPRRHNNFMNSSGRSISKLTGENNWNPIWIHSDDMTALNVGNGDSVRISTPHDYILAVVEADDSLRRGVVAIAHAFGGLVEEDHLYKELGSNTGRLALTDEDFDPISGMPRMGNIPVAISPYHG